MIYDFFYAITNDWCTADIMTELTVGFGIVFVALSPFFIAVFRNSYFIDKMSRKSKKRNKNNQDDFQRQFSIILGEHERNNEVEECRKEIEELKAEIARLKKNKK